MKNLMTKTAVVLASCLLMMGCEKEESTPLKSNNGVNSTTSQGSNKVKNNNDKTDGYIPSGCQIDDFVTTITANIAPSSKSIEVGLKLVETALNFEIGTLTTHDLSETVSFTVDATVTLDTYGNPELTGTNALSYYNDLVVELQEGYENSDLYGNYGSSVVIGAIDIDVSSASGSGGSGPLSTSGIIEIVYHRTYPDDYCTILSDWKALDLLGECNPSGTPTSRDAAVVLERKLTEVVCNTQLWRMHGTTYIYDMKSAFKTGFNTSNIWDGNDESDCIPNGDLKTIYLPGIKIEATNMTPTYPNSFPGEPIYIYDYSVFKDEHPTLPKVAHKVRVFYGREGAIPIDC